MNNSDLGYLAYLVRIWQARSRGQLVWRASVENAHTGERQAFASLGKLFAFLEEMTGCRVQSAESGKTKDPAAGEPPEGEPS